MIDSLKLPSGMVGLVGYGSLILKSSMERTLGQPYSGKRYECHLRGWKRCWDALYPNRNFYFVKEDGKRCFPENILYLNIRRSHELLNGVLYVIPEAELPGFDKREWVYDRVNVAADLSDLTVEGDVWAYVGKPSCVMTEPLALEQAAIRSSYLKIVSAGLDEFDASFRHQYEQSSEQAPEANIMDDCQD